MQQTSIVSNSLFVGKVAWHLTEVDSTNTFALNLLAKSKPIEGTVIYADKQRAGRGQFGSKWQAQANQNLTMSVILSPKHLSATRQFDLSIAVALGIKDCLESILPEKVHIKWPNDIYYKSKKIAGVLIENTLKSNQVDFSVVGIGLNVNQNDFFELADKATSVALELAEEQELSHLMGSLCWMLEKRYLQLNASKIDQLRTDYYEHLLGFDTWNLFKIKATGEEIHAKITGIDNAGRLCMSNPLENYCFDLKEIEFLSFTTN